LTDKYNGSAAERQQAPGAPAADRSQAATRSRHVARPPAPAAVRRAI